MADRHKRPPLALRLPEGLEAWYRAEAAKRGMARNALYVVALTAFRDGPQEAAVKPPGPRRAALGYSKEQQARGRR